MNGNMFIASGVQFGYDNASLKCRLAFLFILDFFYYGLLYLTKILYVRAMEVYVRYWKNHDIQKSYPLQY